MRGITIFEQKSRMYQKTVYTIITSRLIIPRHHLTAIKYRLLQTIEC